jgi:hypothetical protein
MIDDLKRIRSEARPQPVKRPENLPVLDKSTAHRDASAGLTLSSAAAAFWDFHAGRDDGCRRLLQRFG